ncbi:LysE/ArgO family amino acid transporter [Ruminiclostridium papyrosolvens]|uniref:Lysine transporter LysE n=1 Tax=Ruminiclostridium papyrosolvens C7 TaxID=1330534 RepID=U4QXU6_9FIRM|nr:LysE family transporter [Ruminiclostridium papyrosolvens]EPR07732.1 hypothetical protein L323_19605 [Ruminiclostridium papyrosolvens C7]
MVHIFSIASYGFWLSISLILPIGPQNMFILLHSLTQKNIKHDFIIASAAALSDTILIFLGVSGFANIISENRIVIYALYIFSVGFLTYIGIGLWRRKLQVEQLKGEAFNKNLLRKSMHIFAISMFNPQAILDTVVVIGIASVDYNNTADKFVFGLACVLTSFIFFYTIVIIGKLVNSNISQRNYKLLDRLSAILMWIFACRALIKLF